jgi:DHA1 family tetracycline resistance protein-like MFS transporter
MDPNWYFVGATAGGIVSWISLALSSLSDVMPHKWRAPMFGYILAGFSLGFAFSPMLALFSSHFCTSVISASLLILCFIYTIYCLPETLPVQRATEAQTMRLEYRIGESTSKWSFMRQGLLRPFKELSILNRSGIFRLLSVLAFFSGMSTSGDQTLLLYYAEDRLNFNDQDIAILFILIGIIGILVQGVLIKPLTDCFGEKSVVILAFIAGAVQNTLYAYADSKKLIYIAVVVSSFTGMSFPTVSAIKANNAEEMEQGRIQGALYALCSLANAVGPAILRTAYQQTKNTANPGFFFLVATGFYVIAIGVSLLLPKEKANASRQKEHIHHDEVPLLDS